MEEKDSENTTTTVSLRWQRFECASETFTENEMEDGFQHQAEYLDQLKEDQ